jgi:hypothetical protein
VSVCVPVRVCAFACVCVCVCVGGWRGRGGGVGHGRLHEWPGPCVAVMRKVHWAHSVRHPIPPSPRSCAAIWATASCTPFPSPTLPSLRCGRMCMRRCVPAASHDNHPPQLSPTSLRHVNGHGVNAVLRADHSLHKLESIASLSCCNAPPLSLPILPRCRPCLVAGTSPSTGTGPAT